MRYPTRSLAVTMPVPLHAPRAPTHHPEAVLEENRPSSRITEPCGSARTLGLPQDPPFPLRTHNHLTVPLHAPTACPDQHPVGPPQPTTHPPSTPFLHPDQPGTDVLATAHTLHLNHTNDPENTHPTGHPQREASRQLPCQSAPWANVRFPAASVPPPGTYSQNRESVRWRVHPGG